MRTGHYKLTVARSTESFAHNGQFKLSCQQDFHPASLGDDTSTCTMEYPHLNSLLITPSKKGLRGMRHRSCENVYKPKSASINVEQKVRGFLSRAESKFKSQNASEMEIDDGWQVGKIVTLPRKRKLSSALSASALGTLPFSDTVSCLSASSGYSSSSSNSSYGSFKSNNSMCSSLPRRQDGSLGHSPPVSNRLIIFDNPLYDLPPSSTAGNIGRVPSINGIYDIPSIQYMTSPRCLTISEGLQDEPDPVALRCKEFFERRVESSEWLNKRRSPSGCKSDDSEKSDSLLSSLDDSLTSGSSPSSDSMSSFGSLGEKSGLDEKMEFLRNEIASLTQQDNNLFKQLLALHDSISSLKIQNGINPNTLPVRSQTPSSLSSYSEEEQENEQELLQGEISVSLEKDNQVQKIEVPYSCDNSNALFTRARKSYAPTARNRRRSSSVHQPKSSLVHCESTTALVVVHTDDEDSILKPLRDRSQAYTTTIQVGSPSPSCQITNGLNFDKPSNLDEGGLFNANSHDLHTKVSCTKSTINNFPVNGSFTRVTVSSPIKCGGTADSSSALTHPPFREALIM